MELITLLESDKASNMNFSTEVAPDINEGTRQAVRLLAILATRDVVVEGSDGTVNITLRRAMATAKAMERAYAQKNGFSLAEHSKSESLVNTLFACIGSESRNELLRYLARRGWGVDNVMQTVGAYAEQLLIFAGENGWVWVDKKAAVPAT